MGCPLLLAFDQSLWLPSSYRIDPGSVITFLLSGTLLIIPLCCNVWGSGNYPVR